MSCACFNSDRTVNSKSVVVFVEIVFSQWCQKCYSDAVSRFNAKVFTLTEEVLSAPLQTSLS